MLTFAKFKGINNVLPPARLAPDELAVATDVDIDNTGCVRRRGGYSQVVAVCHKNLWQAKGFLLATANGDLISRFPDNTTHTLYTALGVDRVWYCNLPDGRTVFSNGLINGITNGLTVTGFGVPLPASIGTLTDIPGSLFPGDYQWQLTYVRLSDNLEGGQVFSNPVPIAAGGIMLTGLPMLAGYKINIYVTGVNGGDAYYAGSTTGSTFTFTGHNTDLLLPSRTDYMTPAPVGTITAFWRGRTLVAQGSVLWASRPGQWELFEPRRDFKQFSDPITMIVPVDDGIYVGTTKALIFLAGTEFDKLIYQPKAEGRVVLGSGVSVDGELVKYKDSVGAGPAMVCIVNRTLVAGFAGGDLQRLSEGRYVTDAVEVAATFRRIDNIPQYLAVPLA